MAVTNPIPIVQAMLWLGLLALLAFVVVPPAVAFVEAAAMRAGPRHVGFWALARAVAGTCHVPWGRRGSPVIRFALPAGEGRARALRVPGRRGWTVEVRAWQRAGFGFAARIVSPGRPPARWRAPGLAVVELFAEETEHLRGSSMESTDESLLRWLLRHPETRRRLDALRTETGAVSVEVVFAGEVIILRAAAPAGWRAGEAMEHIGPPLVEMLRALSSDLADLGLALRSVGDGGLASTACPGCGGALGDDPWVCPGCGGHLHRGCRETLAGCANPRCRNAADALPVEWTPREEEAA
ncbi:MAG: hypothetical protein H6701_02305 [Myxococcales bacterium]|nr:hypothetical protein [Myxococcales bacterium]